MEIRSLPPTKVALVTALSVFALGACQRQPAATPEQSAIAPVPAQSAPAPAPATYVPPTADQLYQLVAPIALFPDKLLAQTLAASVYPDQVMAAQDWLRNNRSMRAADRLQASAMQPWDPSVKALTAFPDVVDQLASNGDWTRSLGDAYAHDPNQVLDAVQVMRERAQAQGHLRNTPQQRVHVVQRTFVEPAPYPDAVPPPSRTIVIEPAQPDVVYVPRYDPEVVYGEPIGVYREYRYRPPRPYYDTGDLVTTGIISFGVGVLIGEALEHHHHRMFGWFEPEPAWHSWGWNNWGVNWNAPPSVPNYVVYNNSVYAPRTTIINNRIVNNRIDARTFVHNNAAPIPMGVGITTASQSGPVARPTAAALTTAAAMGTRMGMPTSTFAPTHARIMPGSMPQTMPHFTAQMLQAGRPVAAMPPSQRLQPSGPLFTAQAARDPRMPLHTLAMAQPNGLRTSQPMPLPNFRGQPMPQARQAGTFAENPGMPSSRIVEPPRHGNPGMQPDFARETFARDMAHTPPPRQATVAQPQHVQTWHEPAAPAYQARAQEMPREAMRPIMPQQRMPEQHLQEQHMQEQRMQEQRMQEQRVVRFAPPPQMAMPRSAEQPQQAMRPMPSHNGERHEHHDHHNG
ncbi:DUF3300 domain-containing protein [Xanthomonas albilineans]|uniref:DUF3300 domain-containing protein n=1 Tax=Xanthomonas albilineans TaxID=29447 RepID=UPI0005F34F43|nr:DUF3300 domain-containing protein [Xanthomonas albilineans]